MEFILPFFDPNYTLCVIKNHWILMAIIIFLVIYPITIYLNKDIQTNSYQNIAGDLFISVIFTALSIGVFIILGYILSIAGIIFLLLFIPKKVLEYIEEQERKECSRKYEAERLEEEKNYKNRKGHRYEQ